MANMMLIRIAIFGTMVLAVLFALLSIAGNYWIGNGNRHMGLWKVCHKICTDYPDFLKSGKLHATRAFMVLSILAYVVAIAYVVLLHIKKELSMRILGIILLVACFLEVLALGIYTDLGNNDTNYIGLSYKWAYAVGWLSAVVTITSVILTFVFGGER